jgi:O-antigen ligase
MSARASALRLEYVAAMLLAAIGGALVVKRPELAPPAIAAGAVALSVVALGQAGFATLVVFGAVLPYYPFGYELSGETLVPVETLAALFLVLICAPLGWSFATERHQRPIRRTDVLAFAAVAFVIAVGAATAGTEVLTGLSSGGFTVGVVAYVAAKRFPEPRHWLLPAAVGLALLIAMGLFEYAGAPGSRIGTFSGYPILYATLVVLLLPPALAWAYPRSRLVAAGLAVGTVVVVILSETRSAWIALVVLLTLSFLFLFRMKRAATVAVLAVAVAALAALVATSQDLSEVIQTRLTSDTFQTDSFTHRQYSYGYTWDRFLESPLIGQGEAGALKADLERRTGLNAADNGFLSVAGDLGIIGFALAMLPLGIAVAALSRGWRSRAPDATRLALAFGLIGALVVTLFFDVFYWPQSSVLVFGMAGVLAAARHRDPADA